jgi:hypothetical protein
MLHCCHNTVPSRARCTVTSHQLCTTRLHNKSPVLIYLMHDLLEMQLFVFALVHCLC